MANNVGTPDPFQLEEEWILSGDDKTFNEYVEWKKTYINDKIRLKTEAELHAEIRTGVGTVINGSFNRLMRPGMMIDINNAYGRAMLNGWVVERDHVSDRYRLYNPQTRQYRKIESERLQNDIRNALGMSRKEYDKWSMY